jgi:osmoprotectant transport system ATP-binding protein
VTHDLDEAIRLADRIAIMQSGKLVQYDTPEVILSHPANKFVHDFVGTDRALKRLSRLSVKNIIRKTTAVTTNMTVAEATAATMKQRWAWVVDTEGRLTGWMDTENLPGTAAISEIVVHGDAREIGITTNATLREALSRMLGQGFKNIPVVDDEGCLVGEVTLHDVEDATIEAETQR